jgi:hypothetical protein
LLDECRRVLRRGGHLGIVHWNYDRARVGRQSRFAHDLNSASSGASKPGSRSWPPVSSICRLITTASSSSGRRRQLHIACRMA